MTGDVKSYRDLLVWQKAISISVSCYQLTKDFPRDELYGMTSQIRRSSVSIAANIAEGFGREQTRPFIHFLRISQGSLKELETHLVIAEQVQLAQGRDVEPLMRATAELGRMLRAMIRSLETKLLDQS